MSRLLIILPLVFLSQIARATTYTLTATSGGITISQTTESHVLVAGDIIKLHAGSTYSSLQVQGLHGSSGNRITIDGNGAHLSTGSFQQPEWYDMSYVDVINVTWENWYGKNFMDYGIHDVSFINPTATWDGSSNRNTGQAWMQWDHATSGVTFDGTKASTFYNVRITGGTFSGITNTYFMTFGTGWGGSDDNRSLCLDFEIDHCEISDFRNSIGPGVDGNQVGGFFGTMFNYKFHDNTIDRMSGSASFGRAHIVTFAIYGNGEIYNNRQDSSYAQLFRLIPLRWTGLPGYGKGCYQWNNIDHNKRCYSTGEVGQNNKGNRNSTYGIYPTNDTCVNNTIFRTLADSYLADHAGQVYRYHGVIVDDANQTPNILYIANNIIGKPESDHTYDPSSYNNYEYAIISSANANLTSTGNHHFNSWTTAQWDDTTSFVPASGSAFENAGASYSFRTTDFYGNPMNGTPDAGAVERQAEDAGSPPSCTTNSSPANAAVLGTQTTATLIWNSTAGATSYQVWIDGVLKTTQGGTTYNAFGLSAGVTHAWYIVPTNDDGSSTGCSASATTFKTATPPAQYIDLRIKHRQ